jgi:hydrogenase small subunit
MTSILGYLSQNEKFIEPLDEIELDAATESRIAELGISRRGLLNSLAGMASLMALPQSIVPKMAMAATSPKKPSVVYMSFQECTGCLESMVNSFAFRGGATIENVLLNVISLDYQETLMAAAGAQAESQLLSSTSIANGYVLVVDGSIPLDRKSGYSVSGGRSGRRRFEAAAKNAKLIVAVGSCAAFGGLPKASPNPTGAASVGELMTSLGISKPLVNVSGCPPIAEVITGTILYYLTSGAPALDSLKRPTMYFGKTVHSSCYRREYFDDGPKVKRFDDNNARFGGCLVDMGCKGPVTHNACTTIKWNQGVSFPMMSGHGCLGCAEPDFWDRVNANNKKGFYQRGNFGD